MQLPLYVAHRRYDTMLRIQTPFLIQTAASTHLLSSAARLTANSGTAAKSVNVASR